MACNATFISLLTKASSKSRELHKLKCIPLLSRIHGENVVSRTESSPKEYLFFWFSPSNIVHKRLFTISMNISQTCGRRHVGLQFFTCCRSLFSRTSANIDVFLAIAIISCSRHLMKRSAGAFQRTNLPTAMCSFVQLPFPGALSSFV